MKRKRMSRYILLMACSWLLACPVFAQQPDSIQVSPQPQPTEVKADTAATKKGTGLIRGVMVSADLVGVIGGVFGLEYNSYEASVEVNLKNRYFPVLEVGYGFTDTTDDDNDIHYKAAAPYFRLGMNYNFYYKKDTPNSIYAGLRCGFSSFSYDVSSPDLTDPIWGGTVPYNYEGVKATAVWLEIVAGLRTRIWKNFYMGWSVRYKRRLSVTENDYSEVWYIPGFGINGSALFGATYNLIYYLPW